MPSASSTTPDYLDIGSGKPIIMLPGMEGAKEFWRQQWPALAEHYRVIPCGYRRRPLRRHPTVAHYADDIVALMDELDIDRAAVISESFGGMVAQELATTHPERVAALVLCNTFDKARNENFGANMFTLSSLIHPFAFAMPQRWRLPLLDWVGKHYGFVMDQSPGNRALAEYILEHGLDPGFSDYVNRYRAGINADYRRALGEVAVPTLVLRGAEDRLVGKRTTASLLANLTDATLVEIADGGHCCQYSCPEATNRALLDWLTSVY